MTAVLYVDGASFDNPGPTGIGCVLLVDDQTVAEISEDTGYGTNNQAEYKAVIAGLDAALEHGITDLTVRSDSQLLVRQMEGEYKVRNDKLKPLFAEADARRRRFDRLRFEHVRREFNEHADALAKAGAEAGRARGI